MAQTAFKNVDEYIGTCPEGVQDVLEKIRKTIQEAVPEAQEIISYQMPTYRLHENLVHFAAFKNHVSFFPTPSAIEAFKNELSFYETSKGTIKFPLGKPVPYDLVGAMTRFRAEESLAKKRKK